VNAAVMGATRRFGSMGRGEPVLTGADGRFTIDKLRRGAYTVVAEGPRGSSRGETKGVKTGDTTTVTLAQLGTLALAVTQQGQPVKAYDVSCEGPAGETERRAQTDDGTYKLENLAPGEYTCEVEADTGTAEGKVTVPAGEAKLDLALASWASLTGVVVSILDGKPVANLVAIASGEGGQGRAMMDAITGRANATDANGRFTIERVPAGKGRVMLMPRDQSLQRLESHEYTAKEGERTDLGTIKIVPPRNGEAGTLGLATEIDGKLLKVTSVKEGGPAHAAGVQAGDRITALEGRSVGDLGTDNAQKLISSGTVGVGQTIRITLERGATVALTAVAW
jgi:hypothetical protein